MKVFDNSITWLESHAIPCPFHMITGCDCPGCGMQRSVFSLMRGDLSQSLDHHPSGIFFVLFILVFLLHLKFQHRYTRLSMNGLLIMTVVVAILQYILRWMNGELCF